MSTLVAWTGSVATVVFGLLSVYFYLRTRITKRFACVVGCASLKRQLHPDVRISFRGTEVETLTRVLAFVWNAGTGEIRSSDIPPDQWPTLNLPDASKILSVTVLNTSSDHIEFQVESHEYAMVELKFSYLNSTDGATVEILVGGDLNARDVTLTAPIIGGSEPVLDELATSSWQDVWAPALTESGLGLIAGVFVMFLYRLRPAEIGSGIWIFILVCIYLASLVLAMYITFKPLRRRLPAFGREYIRSVATAYGLK
jgi:hypothetical protein